MSKRRARLPACSGNGILLTTERDNEGEAMPRSMKPATRSNVSAVKDAVALIRQAHGLLVRAGATRAATKTHHALESAEGAARHITRRHLSVLA